MHTDLELLSLLALGEQAGTEDERGHAVTCPACAGELSELRRVVGLGRSVGAETTLASPREDVWTRIRDELRLAAALQTPLDRVTLLPSEASGSAAGAKPLASAGTPRRRPLLTIVEAAVPGASHPFDDEPKAHAELAPVEAAWSEAAGQAELATDEHGRRLLQVALQADLPATGVRQAWLVHRDDPQLRQSLGILDGPHGLWTVAHSIDLEQYAILDISQQDTGQTEHSGRTIVRGEFALAG